MAGSGRHTLHADTPVHFLQAVLDRYKLFMGLNSTPGEPITLSYHKLPELSLRLELYKIYNELKLLFSAEQESLLNPSHFHFFPKPCPGIDK